MALFVPEEELFPADAISEQVLLDAIVDNVADISSQFLPTNFDLLFDAMDAYESKG